MNLDMQKQTRYRARERDPYTIRKEMLGYLAETGPISHTRLSYMMQLNTTYMNKNAEALEAAKLIRIIPITEDNIDQFIDCAFRGTKRVVMITKKGLEVLKLMQKLPVIDVKKKADLKANGFS